ncbi:glutathione S-transferase [Sphingomonas vulcanisoli]|uniref:Glutathione S-transferase n=1 Tax=Sphingomonas vulcanisoli TaxID=1658060 RepID=A0ABX0U0V4_9SPHN|nr:glutathione S-transferase family protein [Sphingomonas vulcanisoli]NIJ09625.1 glutathione S-transferase [Sphingomonas vulcanisoli]
MIKIYGTRMSRAGRCMWLLEELGLPYEQVPVGSQDGSDKTPEFLAVNPAGKVPALDDDGFFLRESLAILFYLVAKQPTPLWPDDLHVRALIHQWASWAMTEVEAPLTVIMYETRRAAGGSVDPEFLEPRKTTAYKAIALLEARLSAHPYVASDAFTLGDLIASSVTSLAPMFLDLSPYPAVKEWVARCTTARPAWGRAEARQ